MNFTEKTMLIAFIVSFIITLINILKHSDFEFSLSDIGWGIGGSIGSGIFFSVVTFFLNMVLIIILTITSSTTVVSNRSTTIYNLSALSNGNVTQTSSTGNFFLLAGSYNSESTETNKVAYITKDKDGYMKYRTLKSSRILIREDNSVKPQLKRERVTTVTKIPLYGYLRSLTQQSKNHYFFTVPKDSVNKTYNFNVNK